MPTVDYQPDTIHYRNENPKCPLCSAPANIYVRQIDKVAEGRCDRCGEVCINIELADKLRNTGQTHLVSAWLRRYPEPGELTWDRVEMILKNTPNYSVMDKLNLTLQQLAKMTPSPGANSSFRYNLDYPLIYARDFTEASFYLGELTEMGYIGTQGGVVAMVRSRGYAHLLELEQSGKQSSQAFVAMWFDLSMDDIYSNAIEPAIVDAGYLPLRIDKKEHVNRIDDEIIGQIRRSRFMVADSPGSAAVSISRLE